MDDALQQAYRQALAHPDDAAVREAYARQLVRAGYRSGDALLKQLRSCETCSPDEGVPDGTQRCEACEGHGEIVEFTGRAEDRLPCDRCDAIGIEVCADCDGATLAPLDPAAGPGPCACGKPLALEQAHLVWQPPHDPACGVWLGRCPGCGLAALRRREGGAWTWACQACGWLACRCP